MIRSVRTVLIVLIAFPLIPESAFSQCRDWTDALANSFLSNRANPAALKQFSLTSPNEYSAERTKHEIQGVQQHIARANAYSPALANLKAQLQRFYEIGAELYGIKLNPGKIHVLPDMDLNAFATGNHIFFYDGLLLYYLDPLQFLVRAGLVPRNMTREAHSQLTYRFNWRNDWESLYFVLAHEAAHNLMAHGDERIVEGIRNQVEQLASNARAHRKAVAHGRSSTGLKHYLGQSLLSFLSAPQRSRHKVFQEEEADVVASLILHSAGLRADSGLVWLQRLSLLDGPSDTGWKSVMNSLFCSTHPDRQQRLSNLQRNVSCLQFAGKPCEGHSTYPIPDRLEMVRSEFESIEHYVAETNAIAEGRLTPSSDIRQTVEVKPKPKEANILIDGSSVGAGKVMLRVGRHILTASREGYQPVRLMFAVFPDVKSDLKFKLKKCGERQPCQSEAPEEPEMEDEYAPSAAMSPGQEDLLEEEDLRRPYLKRRN